MFNNSSKILFLFILMSGTMISVSSSSWLSAWMGLEINLLAFIPLMTASNNMLSSEASMKYFLTQSLASSVLLMSVILSSMKSFMYNPVMENMQSIMIFSSLLLKMGAAPFHFWFPSVIEGLDWMNTFFLLTWQKIAPMILSSLVIINYSKMYTITIFLSATFGAIGGLNQTSMKKIMAFSSINHISWMLTALIINESLWSIYFSIYSVITLSLIMLLKTLKLNHINQMFSSMFESKTVKFSLMMSFLSIGGLPPFTGFFPKWLVINFLIMENQIFIMFVLSMTSLITLYFYLRISFSAFMLNYHETKWMSNKKINNSAMTNSMIMAFFTNFSLFLASLSFMVL